MAVMRSKQLTTQEYRGLLAAALPDVADADTLHPEIHTLFTPSTHRSALDPNVTVVTGARGVGKTVWYRALQDPALREVAAATYRIERLRMVATIPGYGLELRPRSYPGPGTLSRLVRDGANSEDIWTAVLLTGLDQRNMTELDTWADRVNWIGNNPELYEESLYQADMDAEGKREVKLVLFDALDRLSQKRDVADELINGILKLALDLRTRTRNIRAKVFIRHDMLDAARLQFPDSSKLTANKADLTWSSASLYGLLFHHIGNAKGEDNLSRKFRDTARGWTRQSKRFVLPEDLAGDSRRQQQVFEGIAGPYMGTNHRKGRPYIWLPNHLIDGIGQVSPRSFLSALRKAAEVTSERFARHEYALHWDGIREGVQAASSIRVDEINEDLPWVAETARPLKGMQVPMEESAVIAQWRNAQLSETLTASWGDVSQSDSELVRTGPRNLNSYPRLVSELIELGVMSRRVDDRIDLPDVYRIAFGIGRKGGVPRLRN
jgi:hypothetical protein